MMIVMMTMMIMIVMIVMMIRIMMMIMMISGTSVKVVVRGRCRANTPVRTGKPTPAYSWWVLLNTSKYCIVLHIKYFEVLD